MRNILKLTYEQPLLMRLYREPSLVEGRWGHQWQYICNDDEAICYLDEGAHDAIQASGAKSGDQILLTKAKVGGKAAYHAQIVDDDATMPDWVRQPEPVAAPIRSTSAAVTMPAERPKPKRTAASNGNGHVNGNGNGNGHTAAVSPQASQPPAPAPHAPGANVYAMALRAAIDAAKYAEEYAQSKHFDLKFTSEDVRCMAATLYIDQRKEGR
jgi:hypothetical protein